MGRLFAQQRGLTCPLPAGMSLLGALRPASGTRRSSGTHWLPARSPAALSG